MELTTGLSSVQEDRGTLCMASCVSEILKKKQKTIAVHLQFCNCDLEVGHDNLFKGF